MGAFVLTEVQEMIKLSAPHVNLKYKSLMHTLIVAEKPSVARDLAKAVGAAKMRNGYLEGEGIWVSWALGHLVSLPEPHEINPEWKIWKRETLPMLPSAWPLQVVEKTKAQFNILRTLMNTCREIICATDAGREGELIFRYLYEAVHCQRPVKRLWISSLTPESIQIGLANLRDFAEFDSLGEAARARACADWLIGLNLSRAYALQYQEPYFVGRVQTPTLEMIVKRELERRDFVPEKYFEIKARFADDLSDCFEPYFYNGTYFFIDDQGQEQKRLPFDQEQVNQILSRIKGKMARLKDLDQTEMTENPPLLYDLSELQRHSNQLYGYTAAATLEAAQSLYEKHKAVSYPRTGSRYLSLSVAKTLGDTVAAIRGPYESLILKETGSSPLSQRYVDDSKVTDHHAIIPTGTEVRSLRFTAIERNLYDLVCRRLLSCWQGPYISLATRWVTEVTSQDLFRSQGIVVHDRGWKRLELTHGIGTDIQETDAILLPKLDPGTSVSIHDVSSYPRETKPRPRFTEASLLSAMEKVGRTLEDRDLAKQIRNTGIGTPATRAAMIETLILRGYILRKDRFLHPTEQGMRLIQVVHPSIKSPELTARWEKDLAHIEAGGRSLDDFILNLQEDLKEKVRMVFESQTQIGFSEAEQVLADAILKALGSQGPKAAGKLFECVDQEFREKSMELQRRQFEKMIGTLSLQGIIKVTPVKFEKEGKEIQFRRISLSRKSGKVTST